MAPTYCNEVIEGRSYKDHGYSPVPTSSSTTYSTRINSATIIPPNSKGVSNVVCGQFCFGINDDKYPCGLTMSEKGSKYFQIVAAAAGNLGIVATGAMLGWTSPVNKKLKDLKDNPLGRMLDDDETSWIGSLVALGAILGSFTSGFLAERLGRKWTLLFCVIPYLIGWVLVGCAAHLEQLYAARLIFGFALGFPFTVLPMYVGEIAETSIRGTVGSFLQLFITIGLLYSYCIGPYVLYYQFAIACACLPVVFFACFVLMPESPYYLLSKGDRDGAVESLVRLRRKPAAAVQSEVNEMQASIDEAFQSQASVMDLFRNKANSKALFCTCALASFQQLTGINFVLFYMANIFEAAGSTLDPSLATIIVGVVQVLASCVTPFVVDRLGRKILLIFSGAGGTISLATLATYFYLNETDHGSVESISILPVITLVVFISTYSVGSGPLPWAVMGEMFASDVKSKASGITVAICWLLTFILTKYTSNIKEYIAFWMFAGFCMLSIIFTIFILPETKGKSLREIQDELCGTKSSAVLESEDSGTSTKK